MGIKRRTFLKNTALGCGAALIMPACIHEPGPYRFFTKKEANCVVAMCEQIIPADENGPGATDAGVIYYIDKQLTEIFTYDRHRYRKGIESLQNSVKQIHKKIFEDMEFDLQTLFLKKMENNALPAKYWQELKSADFFRLVIKHTMQGFYGPPRHGGNKDYMRYRMLDIEFPLVVGRNKYP